MYKSYKARIYPNAEQREFFNQMFGSIRFVWNYILDMSNKAYQRRGETLNKFDMCKEMTKLKRRNEWLYVTDNSGLAHAITQLAYAKEAFYKGRAGYPKFKSKKNPVNSYTSTSVAIHYQNGYLKLPKIDWIRLHNKALPAEGTKIHRATVSLNAAGEYYVSMLVEEEADPLPYSDKSVGLDMGLYNFITDSNGNEIKNPKYLNKLLPRLRKEQRILSRKQRGSANYNKQKLKIAKMVIKTTRQRKYFHDCLIKDLVNEYQNICIEDLDLSDMLTHNRTSSSILNKNIHRNIMDAGWCIFVRKLEQKAEATGRTLVKVPTQYPSSQTCHCCGHINNAVKNVDVKFWTCPVCGSTHNRDHNAAINILEEGLRIIESRC